MNADHLRTLNCNVATATIFSTTASKCCSASLPQDKTDAERRHDIHPNQLHAWRLQARLGLLTSGPERCIRKPACLIPVVWQRTEGSNDGAYYQRSRLPPVPGTSYPLLPAKFLFNTELGALFFCCHRLLNVTSAALTDLSLPGLIAGAGVVETRQRTA